jgi:preprotein translocase subunit SecA
MDYLKDGIGLRAMAQRDPLVEYQREGYALFQSMMGAIREEAIGFLFNLEVQVTGDAAGQARIAARGLNADQPPQQNLSYSAPSADSQGEVEVRNQRGQVEARATALAQQQAAAQNAALTRQAAPPQQAPQRPGAAPAARGAFGQKSDGAAAAPPPANRAERRAQERKR